MHVWFYPVAEPDIYAINRTDPDNPVIVISEGLPLMKVVACAARFATVEERNWVRQYLGYPPIEEDPTYAVLDEHTGGAELWSSSMIPEGLLWVGEDASPGPSGTMGAGVALVWASVAAAVVGVVTSRINGASGLFENLPVA